MLNYTLVLEISISSMIVHPTKFSKLVDYLVLKYYDFPRKGNLTIHSSPLVRLLEVVNALGKYGVKNVVFNFALFGYQYQLLGNSSTNDFGYETPTSEIRQIIGYSEVSDEKQGSDKLMKRHLITIPDLFSSGKWEFGNILGLCQFGAFLNLGKVLDFF